MRGSQAAFITIVVVLCLVAPENAQTQQFTALPPDAPDTPSVTVLGLGQAHGVLGKEVRSSADENMGGVVDVIVEAAPEYKDKQPVIVLGASGALQSLPNE